MLSIHHVNNDSNISNVIIDKMQRTVSFFFKITIEQGHAQDFCSNDIDLYLNPPLYLPQKFQLHALNP